MLRKCLAARFTSPKSPFVQSLLQPPPFPLALDDSDRSAPSRVRFAASCPGPLRADLETRAVHEGKGGFRAVWTGRKVPFRPEAGCRFLELLGVALVQLLRGI